MKSIQKEFDDKKQITIQFEKQAKYLTKYSIFTYNTMDYNVKIGSEFCENINTKGI